MRSEMRMLSMVQMCICVQVHEVRYDKQGAFHSSAKVMDLKVMQAVKLYTALYGHHCRQPHPCCIVCCCTDVHPSCDC